MREQNFDSSTIFLGVEGEGESAAVVGSTIGAEGKGENAAVSRGLNNGCRGRR